MLESIFRLSDSIRYVAIYRNERLETKSKSNVTGASSSESDRYEELLVNPTLLKSPYSNWPHNAATSTVAVLTICWCGMDTFFNSFCQQIGGMCPCA